VFVASDDAESQERVLRSHARPLSQQGTSVMKSCFVVILLAASRLALKRAAATLRPAVLLLLPACAAAAQPPGPDPTPFPRPPSIKGLQVQMVDDALALGIDHAGINVNITALVDLNKQAENPRRVVDGHEFHFKRDYLAQLDDQIRPLSDRGVLVYLILLAYPSRSEAVDALAIHPDAYPDRGYTVGGFNSRTAEGRAWLQAVVMELASRWSGARPECGRVWGWIVGNEVNSHCQWSNIGPKPLPGAVTEYAEAFRIVHDGVRTASAHARLYVPFDHHWAARLAGKTEQEAAPGKDYLEAFASRTADLDWHVAWHPYPEDLFNPRVWADKTATDVDSAPKVTFKNLGVLCRHLERPELRFRGEPRRVILSEQGFHTLLEPDGETLQAAAYAYAWEQCRRLPLVDAFIYHRHVDHAREGGLRLGLWRNAPHSVVTPHSKKAIWELFRRAGTPAWDAAAAAFLPTGAEISDNEKPAPGTVAGPPD